MKCNARNQEIKHNKICEFENVKSKLKVFQNKSTAWARTDLELYLSVFQNVSA